MPKDPASIPAFSQGLPPPRLPLTAGVSATIHLAGHLWEVLRVQGREQQAEPCLQRVFPDPASSTCQPQLRASCPGQAEPSRGECATTPASAEFTPRTALAGGPVTSGASALALPHLLQRRSDHSLTCLLCHQKLPAADSQPSLLCGPLRLSEDGTTWSEVWATIPLLGPQVLQLRGGGQVRVLPQAVGWGSTLLSQPRASGLQRPW